MTHSDSWLENFEALKAHIIQTGHFPNKHTRLNNWCRYQRKRIKSGTILEEQKALFEDLTASRSGEHMGGRKKKSWIYGLTFTHPLRTLPAKAVKERSEQNEPPQPQSGRGLQ